MIVSINHIAIEEISKMIVAEGVSEADFTSFRSLKRYPRYLLPEVYWPIKTRNTKKAAPKIRGIAMSESIQSGTFKTKKTEIRPRNATVIISNTRSTTREESPCETVELYSCLTRITRRRSPRRAGTIRFTVCDR
jgi:hypothetical protein